MGQVKLCYAAADPKLQSDGMAASDADCDSIQISSCRAGVFLFTLSETLLKNTTLLETTGLLVILVYCKKYFNFDNPG